MKNIFKRLYTRFFRIVKNNENFVKYAGSGVVNVTIPWLAIYFLVDRLNTTDLLILTSVYATVQLGAFSDFGLSKFFQLKARSTNITSFFYWVLPRISVISILVSIFLSISFIQLVNFEDINFIWFINIAGIIFSAALRNLVCLKLELMGLYFYSTMLKLLFWMLFFIPVYLLPQYTMHEVFLISSIIRVLVIIIVICSISLPNKKVGVLNYKLSDSSKVDLKSILIFGFACLIGNSLDRYWPGLISDSQTKISFILMMDIGIKTTFFAGAFGQAKINEMFQKGIDEGIGKRFVSYISIASGISFFLISLIAISLTSGSQPDNILFLFLFLYICLFSANQILVPIGQRLVSVRTIANRSLIGVILAIIMITIGIYIQSILFAICGLITKASYELFVYAREKNA